MIDSIDDIARLLVSGFKDWTNYGEVNVIHNGDLTLFNYNHKAAIRNRWNFFERVSRGLILNNKTGEIVARPFMKFFNLGQKLDMKPTGHLVGVTEKCDGSMGILYRLPEGGYAIATRGSFNGDQAQWATEFFNKNYLKGCADIPFDYTLLFEIIYPENRVVVNYGDREDLILIGAINRYDGEDLPYYGDGNCLSSLAETFGFSLPKFYSFNSINDILEAAEKLSYNEEGYVLRFSCGTRLKIKGDQYLNAHRLMTGMNYKRVVEACMMGTIDETLTLVPDELHGEVAQYRDQIRAHVADVEKRVNAAWELSPCHSNRKEFALWVQKNYPSLSSYMFARLDGKSPDEIRHMIYKIEFRS